MPDPIRKRCRTIHAACALGLVAALAAVAGLGVYPMVRQGRAAVAQADTLRGQLAELEGLRKTLAQVEADLAKTQTTLAESEKRFPRTNETDAFMAELAKVADAAGLQVDGLKPKPPQDAGDYRALPVEISGQGSFKQCYEFLTGLRRMTRLTRLDGATLEAEQKVGEGVQAGEKGNCRIKVTLATFMSR